MNRLPDTIADGIEDAAFLDPPADAAANVVHRLLPAGRLKDLLSGTPLGHPAHPMLVTVPIGAWLSANILDVVGGRHGRATARRLMAIGTVAAVPAALTGASDWSDTMGAERRVGLVHAVANWAAIGLYASSWNARRKGRHSRGVALAALGGAAVGVSGWLGGHLSYSIGVGVDTTAFMTGPTEWTDALAESDLSDDRPVNVMVGVVPVLVVRRDGQVFALGDRCTHRGGPLHEGEVVGDCIECPWHSSRFNLRDGHVVRGPATRPQPRLETRVVDGRVQVRQVGEQHALRTNPVASSQAP
ncbi:MAG TPA: Rieske 2Fe-2S domain-containing protein [Mycobacterium sp.]|nr:Rieske 2Fe-2S domain-containing protein [Mycobacterium sp.]